MRTSDPFNRSRQPDGQLLDLGRSFTHSALAGTTTGLQVHAAASETMPFQRAAILNNSIEQIMAPAGQQASQPDAEEQAASSRRREFRTARHMALMASQLTRRTSEASTSQTSEQCRTSRAQNQAIFSNASSFEQQAASLTRSPVKLKHDVAQLGRHSLQPSAPTKLLKAHSEQAPNQFVYRG